jgi:hypothetical protein
VFVCLWLKYDIGSEVSRFQLTTITDLKSQNLVYTMLKRLNLVMGLKVPADKNLLAGTDMTAKQLLKGIYNSIEKKEVLKQFNEVKFITAVADTVLWQGVNSWKVIEGITPGMTFQVSGEPLKRKGTWMLPVEGGAVETAFVTPSSEPKCKSTRRRLKMSVPAAANKRRKRTFNRKKNESKFAKDVQGQKHKNKIIRQKVAVEWDALELYFLDKEVNRYKPVGLDVPSPDNSDSNFGRMFSQAGPPTKDCNQASDQGEKFNPGFFKDACLVRALRALSMKVRYAKHGPFWALADGNAMLKSFGKKLINIAPSDVQANCKYVVHIGDHFLAVRAHTDSTEIIDDGERVEIPTDLIAPGA